MQLVLDSNESLFAFGVERKPASEALLNTILEDPAAYRIRLSRTILEEVRRNTDPQRFRDYGDAFIAAYTEWTGAEYLVTENRDFLALTALPFKIMRAETFLKQRKA